MKDLGKLVIGASSDAILGEDPKVFDFRLKRGSLWMQATLPTGVKASISTDIADCHRARG